MSKPISKVVKDAQRQARDIIAETAYVRDELDRLRSQHIGVQPAYKVTPQEAIKAPIQESHWTPPDDLPMREQNASDL